MASKKYKITQLQNDDSLLELRPETDADIVNVEQGTGHYEGSATNVQAALEEVYNMAVTGGVTGVKGNEESTYRTGNVNLTPANIGAEAAFTDGSATIASESNDVVTIKAGVAQSSGAIANSSASDIVLGTAAKKTAVTSIAAAASASDANVPTEAAVRSELDDKADKSATVSSVAFDSANHKLTETINGTTSDVITFSTAVSSSSTDGQVPTAKAVWDAIDALPEAMVFKGSVGTSGTVEWANLPAASASNEGYTYKVITDHDSAPICKVGDVIVSNATEWVVIPSGDEPSGTVTNIATGAGLTGGPITSSGTVKAALVNETLASNASSYVTGAASKFYAVQLDSNGKLAVNVPWDADTNTWRNIKVNGTEVLGTGISTGALDLVAGSNITLTESSGEVTIAATDTNTATAADNILDGSNNGTEITYAPYSTQQNKLSFDTSSTNPTRTDRLNLNGVLYAKGLYSDGQAVATEQYVTSAISGKQDQISVVAPVALAADNKTISLADNYGDTKNPYAKKGAHLVLAGNGTGSSDTAPSFRALEAADIPNLDAAKITTGTFADARIASASTWNAKQDAITAGAGLSFGTGASANTLGHTNSVTAITTAGFYKVKYDAQGHITGTTAVAKSDITALGIPGEIPTGELNLTFNGTATGTANQKYLTNIVVGTETYINPISAVEYTA